MMSTMSDGWKFEQVRGMLFNDNHLLICHVVSRALESSMQHRLTLKLLFIPLSQLCSISTPYSYGSDDHTEFICIVSKEYPGTPGTKGNGLKEPELTDRVKVRQMVTQRYWHRCFCGRDQTRRIFISFSLLFSRAVSHQWRIKDVKKTGLVPSMLRGEGERRVCSSSDTMTTVGVLERRRQGSRDCLFPLLPSQLFCSQFYVFAVSY